MAGKGYYGSLKGTLYGPAKYLPKCQRRFRFMNYEEEKAYSAKVKESQGFEVGRRTAILLGGISSVPRSSVRWITCLKAAHFAVSEYCKDDSEGKRLQFKSLVKATSQIVEGVMYYLTLTAKDTVDRKTKIYRAKVWILPGPGDDYRLESFNEFIPPPKKRVTRSMSSKRSKRSKAANKGTVVKAGASVAAGASTGAGAGLVGFTALLKEIKSQNPSMPHAMAREATSKKWKALSNFEKQSFITEAILKGGRSSK